MNRLPAIPRQQAIGLLVLALSLCPALALAGEARVRFQDGLLSAVFDATPGAEAFEAIRRATGVEIVVPESVGRKTLTLSLQPAPFEQFVRTLLQALDLGGFALVYERGGAADRLIVADAARYDQAAPARASSGNAGAPAAEARRPGAPGQLAVPFLLSRKEAGSIKLGAPGQVLLVQSPAYARTRTSDCNGTPGEYPVQPVLIMDPTTTYLTSIIVCTAGGLGAGQTLTPQPRPIDAEGTAPYARFSATPQ